MPNKQIYNSLRVATIIILSVVSRWADVDSGRSVTSTDDDDTTIIDQATSKETSQSKVDAQGSFTGVYDPSEAESRWQQEWVDQQTYTYDLETPDPGLIPESERRITDLPFTIDTLYNTARVGNPMITDGGRSLGSTDDDAVTVTPEGAEKATKRFAGTCIDDENLYTDAENLIITDGGRSLRSTDDDDEYDYREQLNTLTQVTRANLVQNIIGHKWFMPSKKELDYYNPSMTSGNISNHLRKLEEVGVVERVVVPQGDRARDAPNAFYILTDSGFELLERHSLFLPQLEEIRNDHARMEKSDEIRRYENAPRPTVTVDYPHPLKGDGRSVVEPKQHVANPDDLVLSRASVDIIDADVGA